MYATILTVMLQFDLEFRGSWSWAHALHVTSGYIGYFISSTATETGTTIQRN